MLLLSSSSGLRLSRDGGERWSAPEAAPPGIPIALFGAPFPAPVLVTSAGVFRVTENGRAFPSIQGSPTAPIAAELLSDGVGGPVLEVRTAEGVLRWNGETWNVHRRGQ